VSRRLSPEQARALAAKPTYGLVWRFHAAHCKAPALDCSCSPDFAVMPDVTPEGYQAARAQHDQRAARIRRGLS
jgi:hypothetical protein